MQQTDVDRRHFLNRATIGALALFSAALGGGSIAFLWPNRPPWHVLGKRDELIDHLMTSRRPLYYAEWKLYLIAYAGEFQSYYRSVGAWSDGLMALSQRCTHLGCRVPFCSSSGFFECPCHAARFDGSGELVNAPATKGMYRHPIRIERNGDVLVDPSRRIEAQTFHTHEGLRPAGEFCVEG